MSLSNWQKEAAAPVENTLPELRALLEEGYTQVIYHAEAGSCAICQSHDEEAVPLEDFIANAQYDAPIYTFSHIGDTCQIEVVGPGLESVFLDYSGRV